MSEEQIENLYIHIPIPDNLEVGEMASIIASVCLSLRQDYISQGFQPLRSTFTEPDTINLVFKKLQRVVRISLRPV
jgi:hypothetical protein